MHTWVSALNNDHSYENILASYISFQFFIGKNSLLLNVQEKHVGQNCSDTRLCCPQ